MQSPARPAQSSAKSRKRFSHIARLGAISGKQEPDTAPTSATAKRNHWSSERDGWRHLYLYDAATGKVKNQITKGSWAVRAVNKVDEEKRQIWFEASGMYPGKDPSSYYRIN